jgi:hypothetical protein
MIGSITGAKPGISCAAAKAVIVNIVTAVAPKIMPLLLTFFLYCLFRVINAKLLLFNWPQSIIICFSL